MNAERLLALADKLESVPVDRFNMNQWASVGFYENECGTAACAIGWCPIFFPEDWTVDSFDSPCLVATKEGGAAYGISFPAAEAEKFFDLTVNQSNYLFVIPGGIDGFSPTDEAERIREFVRNNGYVPA